MKLIMQIDSSFLGHFSPENIVYTFFIIIYCINFADYFKASCVKERISSILFGVWYRGSGLGGRGSGSGIWFGDQGAGSRIRDLFRRSGIWFGGRGSGIWYLVRGSGIWDLVRDS